MAARHCTLEMLELMGPMADRAFWARQRILLTGHTGFKGSWASLWLEHLGAEVHGLALAPDHVPDLYSQLAPFSRGASTIADITDLDAVRRAVAAARPTLVLHMAAQPLVRRSYAEPLGTFATNVTGTAHVLEAVRDAPDLKAVLIVTTDKVYRNDGSGRRFVESDPLGGNDPYSASKAGAEMVTAAWAGSYFAKAGVAVATARGGNVVGGGDWSADRLVPDVWRALHTGTPLSLRYPSATRPWQHVLDCLAGYLTFLRALATRRDLPTALNFGPAADDAPVTVGEVADIVGAALNLPDAWRMAPGDHPPEAPALALDSGAAVRELGWKPLLSARSALLWSADWYRRVDAGEDARDVTLDQLLAYETAMTATPACLGCSAPLTRTWVDLGLQPLANSNIRPENADQPEPRYPLHARVCDVCLLVQVESVVPREAIFNEDYAYFSSFSDSWLAHCGAYARAMTERFGLGTQSQVVEIASNDGYMLQYFVAAGVPVLGVEPSANTAAAAIARGVPTDISFFSAQTARRLVASGHSADLLAAKNVLAHVPDINDFVAGVAILLQPEGVFTVEFPHLLRTIEGVQFDTIYHEHYTYLSLLAVETIFARHGLRVFDCEEHPTHGGSLRIFACRTDAAHALRPGVAAVRSAEIVAGLDRPAGYEGFDARCRAVRDGLNAFLAQAAAAGKTVAGYGAAAKGNTLLNYCGVGAGALLFIADRSPAKQGRLSPGSRIPIRAPEAIFETRPDYVLILPWNLRAEVTSQLAAIRDWGGRFVTAVPTLQVA